MKNIFSLTNILGILIIAFSFQGLVLAQMQTKTHKQLLLDASQPTVLITGSNRGIGFAFVQYYSKNGWNVIATCRNPNKADDLQDVFLYKRLSCSSRQ